MRGMSDILLPPFFVAQLMINLFALLRAQLFELVYVPLGSTRKSKYGEYSLVDSSLIRRTSPLSGQFFVVRNCSH